MQTLTTKLPYIIIGLVIFGVAYYFYTSEMYVLRSLPDPETAAKNLMQKKHHGRIISGTFDESKMKTDEEWKKILTPEQFTILRQAGTEVPFTGALLKEKRKGTYYSVGCNTPVFRSEQKFESGTGWPSFWDPIDKNAIVLREDTTFPGEPRVEVLDPCGGHLGHVFDDGPEPTGKRYCMNSVALKFVPDKSSN